MSAEETNTMIPEIKEKWVTALRSGDYKQTSGALAVRVGDDTTNVAYCCLGVLCEIAVDEGVIPSGNFLEKNEIKRYDEQSTAFLPTRVIDWSRAFTTTVVVAMNDEGSSFDEIADYIEENY